MKEKALIINWSKSKRKQVKQKHNKRISIRLDDEATKMQRQMFKKHEPGYSVQEFNSIVFKFFHKSHKALGIKAGDNLEDKLRI